MRSLLVLALVALVAGAVAGVISSERDETPSASVGAVAPLTPVLSARRVPALLAAPIADRRLGVALDALLAEQPGNVCLSVGASGRTIYERQPDVPLVPASVEKLLTAVVALQVLGPDHRFRTSFVAEAPPVDGVVQGDLWLVGGGDPLLATADYAARFRNQPQLVTSAESLADQLAAAGVTTVTGQLLGDGSRFDTDRYPDAWPARFVDQDQSGPLTGLTVNDGWEAYPPNPDTNVPDETPAADPDAHAAAVVAGLLAARGTTVAGTGSGPAPAGAVEIAGIDSPPLAEVVGEMLGESDNQTAELVLKEIARASGRPPTTVDGAATVLEVGAQLGLPMGGVEVADGSGLSDADLITCNLARSILERGGAESPIVEGLAVAGQTGTLALRFVDQPVEGRLRAKTGTLNQVTSLAGVLDTLRGERVTFSFIVNLDASGRVTGDDFARQDRLAAVLDTYPEGPSLDELGPQPVAVPGG